MTKYFDISDFEFQLSENEYYCFKCGHQGKLMLHPMSNVANYYKCPDCNNESYANKNMMRLNGHVIDESKKL